MRSLLDLMRENPAHVKEMPREFEGLLGEACLLKILDPELGDQELIQSVAAELAHVVC